MSETGRSENENTQTEVENINIGKDGGTAGKPEGQTPVCQKDQPKEAPKGIEEFDLDDIEVIESKVFA